MSDLAQVLLLPPPTPYPQRLPARDSNELAVNADAQGGGDSARARRFRFRVYEGSESGETSVDQARGSNVRGALNGGRSTNSATSETAQPAIRYSTGDSGSGSSSAFLAQAFAQEELGEGLHNPPFAVASAAYGRAGNALNVRASAGVDIRA
jgi:hypothetical protein